MSKFVSPTGYVDIEDNCALDNKSTRSRESINPKEDLSFYFQTYLIPKYGLDNINVNNCASFMKELEMNWSKLTDDLKDKVLDIMVDGIFTGGNYDFKTKFLAKLGVSNSDNFKVKSNFGPSKSNFGSSESNTYIAIGILLLGIILFVVSQMKNKSAFPKMT